MKAMVCEALGENEGLRPCDLPPPLLAPGGVRLKIHAAGVNFADTLMIAGLYQEKKIPPFTPGLEVAGEVLETAPGVMGLPPGQRVMALLDSGGFAEEAVAQASDVHPIPDSMDMIEAAGFPVAWGTAYHGLAFRARLKAGETLVVTGATGGVGMAAVAVGAALGAKVIAVATKPKLAQKQGAAFCLDSADEDLRGRVKDLTGGRGADVVFDTVGGKVFDSLLRSTAPDGRLLVIGFASGAAPQIPANILLVKNLSVIGYYWGAYRRLDPDGLRLAYRDLLAWQAEGRIRVPVGEVLPLVEANTALTRLRTRTAAGKLVLRVA